MEVFGINFLSPVIDIIYDLGIDLDNICNLEYGNYIAIFIVLVFAIIVLVFTLRFLYCLMTMFFKGGQL